MGLECGILGPLRVAVDDRPVELTSTKEKTVLVLLALRAGEVVSSDYLIDRLWGEEPPASATNTLQTYVSRLRKVLGAEVLLTRRPGYVLDIPAEAIDARRFELLVRSGQRALADGDAPAAVADLRRGLELWRGPPLSDFAADEFAADEIRALEEKRLTALDARIRAELTLGRHTEVISELESLVRDHPLREGLWASLMTALYRSGRQGDALRAFADARRHLAEDLGIEPGPELRRLEEQMLQQDPDLLPAAPAPAAWSGNLPADITSFVGRIEELVELEKLARHSRLVTLLGPAGIGKSRLALELARRLGPDFVDGAWLVDLGRAPDPASVLDEIVARWPVPPSGEHKAIEDLGTPLRDRSLLLVLDNCERTVAGVAPTAEALLAVAPGLRIVATSREPLECRGEALWRVGPLQAEAVELFRARAGDAVPGFVLDEAETAIANDICSRLDGIPLAIELAASRLRSMTLDELASQIDDRFGLLVTSGRTVPERLRTLHHALEWSYDLLEPNEQELFGRLAVMFVEFPRRAVEVVCADTRLPESALAPLLERLADKSLVMRVERDGRTWYRLLETVRVFSYHKSSDVLGEIHERGFFILLAGRTDHHLMGSVEEMWPALLDGDSGIARRSLTAAANSFREDEGTEMAGVIAARMTQTGRVGFVGSINPGDVPLLTDRLDAPASIRAIMRRLRDGFRAGVRSTDPRIEIIERYLTDKIDFAEAFQSPVRAGELAAEAFAVGVDVIFHATGSSGHRIIEIARRVSEDTGTHRWVIGVDFDEYQDVEEHLRPHVLASVRKQVPLEVFRRIKQAVADDRLDDAPWFILANGGMSIATTGGHIDHLTGELERVQAEILSRNDR